MQSTGGDQTSVEIEDVTPAKAQQYLALNRPGMNRTLRDRQISYFAQAMRDGMFVLTSDAIAIETLQDGSQALRNGQHRLHAVVLTGLTQKFLVMHNLPDRSMIVLDTGKKRSLGDILYLVHRVEDATHVASVVRLAYAHENGMIDTVASGGGVEVAPALYLEWFEKHPECKDAQRLASQIAKDTRLAMSAVAVAKLLFDRVDAEESEVFFDRLRSGAELSEGNPILTVRNWIFNQKTNKMYATPRPPEQLAVLIKTWNDWAAGKTRRQVKYNRHVEAFPEVIGL